MTGSGGDASKEGESYLKQAQDGASDLAGQASETVNAGVKQAQDALGMNGQTSISIPSQARTDDLAESK